MQVKLKINMLKLALSIQIRENSFNSEIKCKIQSQLNLPLQQFQKCTLLDNHSN